MALSPGHSQCFNVVYRKSWFFFFSVSNIEKLGVAWKQKFQPLIFTPFPS